MTVLAVTSGRGSPGVTSLAVGLAIAAGRRFGPEAPFLVEADPNGGALALRYDLPAEPSLATLASELTRNPADSVLSSHAVDLNGVRCLSGPPDPLVARWMLGRAGSALSSAMAAQSAPVVVDLGRLGAESEAMELAKQATIVAIVLRPTAEDIQAALFTARTLRTHGCSPILIAVGDRPFNPAEMADVAGLPLAGIVPDDPAVASALSGGQHSRRRFFRSLLWRSIDQLAVSLLDPRHGARSAAASALPPPPQGGQPVPLPPPPGVSTSNSQSVSSSGRGRR